LENEKKKREDAGVELYTLQQNLARLQAQFEAAEENFAVIKGLREEAERSLKHKRANFEKEHEKQKNQEKNCISILIQLSNVSMN
jgi:ABC-type enterochelin transport system substrate-binding protein